MSAISYFRILGSDTAPTTVEKYPETSGEGLPIYTSERTKGYIHQRCMAFVHHHPYWYVLPVAFQGSEDECRPYGFAVSGALPV